MRKMFKGFVCIYRVIQVSRIEMGLVKIKETETNQTWEIQD